MVSPSEYIVVGHAEGFFNVLQFREGKYKVLTEPEPNKEIVCKAAKIFAELKDVFYNKDVLELKDLVKQTPLQPFKEKHL
ncbi:MAG: hypothetical protein WCG42_01640 [Parachlamydiaceae bacterium]